MSKYETVVVFDGNLPQDAIERESKKVEELLCANGSIVKIDEWGKKYLAYPIKKKTAGFYVLFVYEYVGNVGNFIESHFKFNENIIRYLTVVHENNPIFAENKTETDRVNDNSGDDAEEEEEE